jgi:tRNA pseudouridine55 synthase
LDGVIVVDKPGDWTSHDVVGKMRRIAATKKVGHLGTLDPIATGVLPLVIGRATRLAQFYTRSAKCYEASVRFGWATKSYDRAGEIVGEQCEPHLTRERIDSALDAFRGEIDQVPPPVSAKKIGGQRAYDLVRKSIEVNLEPVRVTIHSITVLDAGENFARLRVECSGGTYVRSIAHDLGIALGCGAHLDALRRLASGEFAIGQAHTLEELEALAGEARLDEVVVPPVRMLPNLESVVVDDVTAAQIRSGRDFHVSAFRPGGGAQFVKAVSLQEELIAIGEAVLPNVYHPCVVL